ncbi:MAG: phosphate ABC transporter ATP-binding protein [Planctomycetes bacterium]|nr:phosphate ABC transporter ATP-binding protein [Planctomycetota bacterium]
MTASNSTAGAVHVENVSIRYGAKFAIQNVSLTIPPQAITAIIGPSGCGKTSLLCSLNRLTDLIPGCGVTGLIRIGDTNVLDRRTDVIALRRRVGMIFQHPNLFPMTIRRNLELPLREHGLQDRRGLQEQIECSLTDVGLWTEVRDRLDRPALSLSGGQQQRLCLARALSLQPSVLLLDEPCSALDPQSTSVIEELLLRLRATCTVAVVTHNLAQARRIAERTALLWPDTNGSRLVECSDTQSLFESPQSRVTEAFISGKVG